jgi:hypothetical protein
MQVYCVQLDMSDRMDQGDPSGGAAPATTRHLPRVEKHRLRRPCGLEGRRTFADLRLTALSSQLTPDFGSGSGFARFFKRDRLIQNV